jgi:UDP-2,3-diacylglucosamine pyrophosphatase LpxH
VLVVLSDLHFCDGTASPRNVKASAFQLLLQEIYDLAARSGARDLDLVLLGDIFDLLRTERWFEDADGRAVPLEVRPWGAAEIVDGAPHAAATLDHALAIADEIVARNREALASLRGETLVGAPARVRRIFVPGNHDRLCLHDVRIRDRVRRALGAVDESGLAAEGIFTHRLEMARYALLARHGHEHDPWNFARWRPPGAALRWDDADYLPTPIGDPIITELIARLPRDLKRRLADSPAFAGTPELDAVYARLQRIEDVRPLIDAFRWAFYQADRAAGALAPSQASALHAALRETVRQLAADFHALPFYRAWHARAHEGLRFDEAAKLDAALRALAVVEMETVGRAADAFDAALDWYRGRDAYRAGAAREDLTRFGDGAQRFVVYGHTHEPEQAALRAQPARDLYLNSGTWRRREFAADDAQGFVGWESCSYVVFYDADEARDGERAPGPAVEHWTGMRMR